MIFLKYINKLIYIFKVWKYERTFSLVFLLYKMNTTIYVLKLEDNKYYVGKTSDIERRMINHVDGVASSWTKKYKPLGIVEILHNMDAYDEDKYTLIYMDKYGINNVRGGVYVTEELNKYEILAIKKKLWSANDKCMRCGRNSHFIKNCYASKDIYGEYI